MVPLGFLDTPVWLNFPRIVCETWHRDNLSLMGDAAHTPHFSIGSGTKLAIEDASKLADVLHGGKPLAEALVPPPDRRPETLTPSHP